MVFSLEFLDLVQKILDDELGHNHGVVDLTGDEDLTDEDGDTGMGDSRSLCFRDIEEILEYTTTRYIEEILGDTTQRDIEKILGDTTQRDIEEILGDTTQRDI
ncbi:hypothetical protein Tco_0204568 [Tanacetum coccineum]